ncbi:hypothetical protein Sste5346_007431 [Sporothrix stenoceras]|uniref:Gluconokinase n=1 Tax=Sporothrix stenoceras TaxID=5173 RepID=A0ABR3YVM5_9PEZI
MLSSYNSPVAVGPTSPKLAANSAPAPTTASVLSNGVNGVNGINGVNGVTATAKHNNDGSNCHIWLVTGPAGCGKSTVALHLANSLNLPYVEGDEFHPAANIEKMRNGIPLTDADRWDWLTALREESMRQIASGRHEVVMTCSALKRKYRDVIRVAPYFNTGVSLHFIYLSADPEVLHARVAGRKDHYMGPGMVQSQLDILEPPQADETDVICFDVDRPQDDVKAAVLQKVTSIIREEEA